MKSFLSRCAIAGAFLHLVATTPIVLAQSATPTLPSPAEILPPLAPWSGASRSLVVPSGDPWITPCEASGFTRTPRYDETVAWLRRLAEASSDVKLVSIGRSPEGRDIWMAIASRGGASTPEALRAIGNPVLLAQAGIHAGEIDGKDAGMMLLRDLTVRRTKRELLERASFLFVPIFNVDGHERYSAFGRINQRGPVEMGWRTTAMNLNLNRDYGKLDCPEMRAMVRALRAWDPDLYFDVHVTDGADYQYDVTWGFTGTHAFSPASAAWMDRRLTPTLRRDLQAAGHVPGPLVFPADDRDFTKGLVEWTASARFSNGYGDLRHLPTVLVENHSLKPYDRRVLGTYVLLESTLRSLGESGAELRRAIEADRALRRSPVPLDWKLGKGDPPRVEFLGIESRVVPSAIAGGTKVEWTGKPISLQVPMLRATEPAKVAARPKAYWIPPWCADVLDRLAVHGIQIERLDKSRDADVEWIRIVEPKLAASPNEGRVPIESATLRAEPRRRQTFAPGWSRVSTDQPLGDLAILLLEPESPESFFRWGFFLATLERSEYSEAYVLEPLAERMLASDPALRAEFEKKLKEDAAFAGSAEARLRWFYERTPYFDDQWLRYPIARE